MLKIKVFLICILFVFTVNFGGCYKKKNIPAQQESRNIEFVVKMNSGDFWKVVRMGAYAAAREYNVNLNFIAPEDEKDINDQLKLVSEAVEKRTDALIIAPSDFRVLSTIVESASAKMPVIIVDSEMSTDKYKSFIATDNKTAGAQAGSQLIQEVGEQGEVAVMSFVKGSGNAESREEGLQSVLSKYPGIKVIATEYCNSDRKQAYELTKKLLVENSGIVGIAALNAAASEGVAEAVEELGLIGKVRIIAFDSTSQIIQYLEKGTVQATIIQNPFSMGYLSVKYAVMAANGEKIPKTIDTKSWEIRKDNMYDPDKQKLIFPFSK